RGKEPLRTLATYRRDATDPTDVNFGQNLIHETKSGTLRVGDRVTLL
ncbi:MAG: MOSC domain-containing protein, partial [Opitutaceae bacterium]|nr:MOSC domain-containing protein [Opitutaceae bacterium]